MVSAPSAFLSPVELSRDLCQKSRDTVCAAVFLESLLSSWLSGSLLAGLVLVRPGPRD